MENIEDRSIELLPWHKPSVQRLLITVGTKFDYASADDGEGKENEVPA